MKTIKRICVFCGSSDGARPAYRAASRELGCLLAERRIELVYGGGNVGLMGEISNAVVDCGGRVTGVIPRSLAQVEVANTRIQDLRIVGSMHERKALMADLADAFIALPGGTGTLDEFAEIVTWYQLGIHRKPFGLLNTERYFDGLISFLDHAVAERFLKAEHRGRIIIERNAGRLIERLAESGAPAPLAGKESVIER